MIREKVIKNWKETAEILGPSGLSGELSVVLTDQKMKEMGKE